MKANWEIHTHSLFQSLQTRLKLKKAVEASYGVSVKKVRTMIYGAETRTRYTKRGIQNSKKGSYKKAIVKVSEGDRIDFFANL